MTKVALPNEASLVPVVHIERAVFDQEAFGLRYRRVVKPQQSLREKMSQVRDKLANKRPTARGVLSGIAGSVRKTLPVIQIMRHYQWKEWIVGDIISGISVGAIHIPQCMGYAKLSEVPPPYGLYSTLFPLIVYFFLGTSRHLSIGTVSLVSLLVGASVRRMLPAVLAAGQEGGVSATGTFGTTVATAATLGHQTMTTDLAGNFSLNFTTLAAKSSDWSPEETEARIAIAATLAMVVGIIQFSLGFMRLGLIATFMSTPFNSAFMTGSAFHTAMSQLPPALGYKIKAISGVGTVPLQFIELCRNLGKTNPADIITALITLAILVFIKEFINYRFAKKLPVPLPADLIVLVLGTVIAYVADLNKRFDLKILKDVQGGIPVPKVPRLITAVDTGFLVDGFVVSIIAFVVCVSMAKIYARKYKYSIDTNQELIAYGSMNFVSSFFSCFATAQAPPRTLVHDAAGGKSQVSGVVSAILVLLVCLFLGPLFYTLPNAVLASIILVALLPLFKQFREIKVYWNLNKFDCVVWLVTCFSTMLLDLPLGILIGIGWNLLTMCAQSFVVRGYSLATADDCGVFVPAGDYGRTTEIEGVKIFRYESDLFFANVENFKAQLFKNTIDPQKATLIKNRMSQTATVESVVSHSTQSEQNKSNGKSSDVSFKKVGEKDVKVTVLPDVASDDKNKSSESQGYENLPQRSTADPYFFRRPSMDVQRAQAASSPLSQFYQRPTMDSIAIDADDSDLEEELRSQAIMRKASVHSVMLDTHTIVLDCGAIGYIDFNGLLTLRQLFEDYRDADIRFLLAGCGKFVIAKLKKSGIYDEFSCFIFPSLFDAVMASKLDSELATDIF